MTKKLAILVLIITIISNSVLNPARNDKKFKFKPIEYVNDYSKPLFFNLSIFWSPNIFLYIPDSNYTGDFAFTLDLGMGVEYRLNKIAAFEGMFFLNVGYHYSETYYLDNGCMCWIDPRVYLKIYQVDLFLQLTASFKFYFLNAISLKNNYKMKFYIRLGAVFEGWPLPYYFFLKNDEFIGSGYFWYNNRNALNAYGNYIEYKNLMFPINGGITLGFGAKFFKNDYYSISPELKYTFYGVPILNGLNWGNNVKGNDAILIRNNGVDDKNILDFKSQLQIGVTFSFVNQKVKEKVIKIVLDFLNFYPDSTKLLPESELKLKIVSLTIKKYKNMKFKFVGHANSTGNKKNEYNLSVARAKSIREYLINLGVTTSKTSSYEGRGSDENIGDINTEKGKRKNRRVEIFIE